MDAISHLHYYPRGKEQGAELQNPRLLYTGTVGADPAWFNISHSHGFCELLYVAGGQGHMVVQGQEYSLQGGDLLVMNPGVMHEERSDADNPLELAFCGIDAFKVSGLPANTLLPQGGCPVIATGDCRERLERTFLDLIQETVQQVSYCSEMSHSLVNILLVLVLRLLLSQQKRESPQISQECRLVAEFINDNYRSPISLAGLSQTVYVSKHHLAHLFKNQTGISPIRYLINKRIEEAQRLLRETRLSIADVAMEVGYNDPVYFSQLFKKSTGTAPSAYRAANAPSTTIE